MGNLTIVDFFFARFFIKEKKSTSGVYNLPLCFGSCSS